MITTEILTSRIRTYEPSFDRREYLKTNTKDRERLDKYTTRQVETLLGERLDVLLSKNRYEIKNNVIYGKDMNGPFIDVMERGRDYRRKIGGEDRVDSKREQAEIDGFSFVQDVLCHPDTPADTMIVSISPSGEDGSLYKHNFYDIFSLKKEGGERFIEVRRYSSALFREEYREKLELFYPNVYGKDVAPTDDYFLSHPVVVNNSFLKNPEDVHAYLHKNHEYMEEGDFEQVRRVCSPFIKRYIRALWENPRDVDTHSLILDAILNKADEEVDYLRKYKGSHDIFVRIYDSISLQKELEFFGHQPVRQVATGCGTSSGFSNNKATNNSISSSPFSVSEFGTDQSSGICRECQGGSSDNHYHCPKCRKEYADETNKPKEERTKQCICGFEFDC